MEHALRRIARALVFFLSVLLAPVGAVAQSSFLHNQSIGMQPLLQLKTPKQLELFGEPVPLERRDVWERLDKQYLLALSRDAQIILWLKRSRLYFPFIEESLTKRGLPDDLKYLAVAESDLNKYALSPKGAAGTWQFMQKTGMRFGLENQSWKDERYAFEKATSAALDYLALLYERFGQWMLAAAAYNCGEDRLAREIEAQKTDRFVDLYLPRETEEYLFRIMAIKIILANPERHGFVLDEDDYYLPWYAEEVELNLSASTHVQTVAASAMTTLRTIKELNPELKGYYLPAGRHTLRIPAEGVTGFAERLSSRISRTDSERKSVYTVRRGDTLSAIAAKLELPLAALMQWNGLASPHLVYEGQKLVYYSTYKKQ